MEQKNKRPLRSIARIGGVTKGVWARKKYNKLLHQRGMCMRVMCWIPAVAARMAAEKQRARERMGSKGGAGKETHM